MVKGERLVVNEADAPNNRVSPLTTNHSTLTKNTSHLYDNPQCIVPSHLPQVDFRIHCGKGTYIRSIARDLGLALGSGAFLSALRREQVGPYTIDQAITIDQVEDFFN